MRTTVRLPDELYKRARVAAIGDGRTFTSFLEEALEEALRRHSALGRELRIEPFHGGRLIATQLDDNSALLELMDGHAGR